MGASKNYQYPHFVNDLARTGKAVGHSARVSIMVRLFQTGVISHREIMQLTQLADATVCQHLNELYEAGLIRPYYNVRPTYLLTDEAPHLIRNMALIIPNR